MLCMGMIMIKLTDCGKETEVIFDTMYKREGTYKSIVVPIMVIKAPSGIVSIFDGSLVDEQCKLVKAFMEQHKND